MTSSLFDLSGKVAMVTGASSGLGVQIAKALAGAGADLAIVARREEKLKAVSEQIEALGVRCYTHKCDVNDRDDIRKTVADIEARYGKIDILCNNAGTNGVSKVPEPAESQSDENWESIINTNLNAVYYMTREVGRGMVKRGYGKIIMTASIHAQVGMAEIPITGYAASKGGVQMLVRQLAVEWAKYGITVNAIGPAYFPTNMTNGVLADEGFQEAIRVRCPMGRTGREGELDGAIVYFASDASSYTTGQTLMIDGGWTAI